MAEEMTTIVCPQCGKTLQIPADLEEFSCVYCGNRMRRPAPPVREPDRDALRNAKEKLRGCVIGRRELRQSIKKDNFEDAFRLYEAQCGPMVRDLNDAWQTDPACLDEVVNELLDALDEGWQQERSASRRAFAQDDDKIVVAIFLVPAVRHLKFSVSEPFCTALHEEWLRRWPKSPFNLGDYETISAGFRKKYLGLCFITTAVCSFEGKPDDCAELTAFRRFRDGYLAACPDGPALIREYYDTAPQIVTMIALCADEQEAYGEIRARWLDRCWDDLQNGRREDCKRVYTDMVRTLQDRYLN